MDFAGKSENKSLCIDVQKYGVYRKGKERPGAKRSKWNNLYRIDYSDCDLCDHYGLCNYVLRLCT